MPIPLGGFWRWEVQVVGHSDRLGSNTAEIAGCLSHCCNRSPLWVKRHPAIGTIQGGRNAALRRFQRRFTLLRTKANHRSISATGSNHRVGQYLLIVLAIDPALAGNRGVIKQTQQIRIPIAIAGGTRKICFTPGPVRLDVVWWLREKLVLIDRGVFCQGTGRYFCRYRTVLHHPHHSLLQNPTNDRRLKSPTPETLHQLLLPTRTHNKQHALLRFRKQEFVGGHAVFSCGHQIEVQLNPHISLGSHLRTTTGETCSTHILRGNHIPALKGFQASLNQALLKKGISNLHRRAIIQ